MSVLSSLGCVDAVGGNIPRRHKLCLCACIILFASVFYSAYVVQAWSSRKDNSSVSLAWFCFEPGLLAQYLDRPAEEDVPDEEEVCFSIRSSNAEIKRGHRALGWPSLEFDDNRSEPYMDRWSLTISESTSEVFPAEIGMRHVFAVSFAYSEFVVLESEFASIGESMTDGLLRSGGGSIFSDHSITKAAPWYFAIMEGKPLPFFIGVSLSERYQ